MKLAKIASFVVLMTSLNNVLGQDDYWMNKQLKADTIITDMKTSMLLIQLNSENIKSRSRYSKPGANSVVMNSFKEDFDFCNVVFYYASDSSNVFNNSLDKVNFYDHSLGKLPLDFALDYSIYIGVFDRIQEDSARNFDGYYYVEGPDGKEQRARYSQDPEKGYPALVLYDADGVQLPRPFPFNVRTFDANFIRRNPITVIKKMNSKLNLYYQKRKIEEM